MTKWLPTYLKVEYRKATTTMLISKSSSYSEKFVHPNLARPIELGGAKRKNKDY